jgi:hypothetical protein
MEIAAPANLMVYQTNFIVRTQPERIGGKAVQWSTLYHNVLPHQNANFFSYGARVTKKANIQQFLHRAAIPTGTIF